jgi:hypothetical protein
MNSDDVEKIAPVAKSPLDPWRGSGKHSTKENKEKPLATEKKKPGRKKKVVEPMRIVISDTPIVLSFD